MGRKEQGAAEGYPNVTEERKYDPIGEVGNERMQRDIYEMKSERLQPESEVGEHVCNKLQRPVVVPARFDSLKLPNALSEDRGNVAPVAELGVANDLAVVVYSKAET